MLWLILSRESMACGGFAHEALFAADTEHAIIINPVTIISDKALCTLGAFLDGFQLFLAKNNLRLKDYPLHIY